LLLLGKHASAGLLGSHECALRSGSAVKLSQAKLARYCPQIFGGRVVMSADSPAYAYWGKPPVQVPFNAALDRFCDAVRGRSQAAAPPVPILWPGDDMLAALRNMGPDIGWDVETLGADPLEAPITCIGISDGDKTISVAWDNYETTRQGAVNGIATSVRGVSYKIQQEIFRVLESNRCQVTQNGSYDVLAMSARGLPGRNDWDIMHAYAVLWPECPKTLEAIALHLVPELDRRWKFIFRAGRDDDAKGSDVYAESPEEDLRDYNGMDAWATVKAKKPLEQLLAMED
jgi:hypothetical protein